MNYSISEALKYATKSLESTLHKKLHELNESEGPQDVTPVMHLYADHLRDIGFRGAAEFIRKRTLEHEQQYGEKPRADDVMSIQPTQLRDVGKNALLSHPQIDDSSVSPERREALQKHQQSWNDAVQAHQYFELFRKPLVEQHPFVAHIVEPRDLDTPDESVQVILSRRSHSDPTKTFHWVRQIAGGVENIRKELAPLLPDVHVVDRAGEEHMGMQAQDGSGEGFFANRYGYAHKVGENS